MEGSALAVFTLRCSCKIETSVEKLGLSQLDLHLERFGSSMQCIPYI